jgi:DNA anti-recombination protein RmuC
LSATLAQAQEDKVNLEAEVADLTLQMSNLLEGAKGADIEKAMAKLTADRTRIEGRLKTLVEENKKLRKDVETYERTKSDDWDDERRENALLREQINDLAAEVVGLTIALDGPDSPIRKALGESPSIDGTPGPAETIVNLADRVRALQKTAAATR